MDKYFTYKRTVNDDEKGQRRKQSSEHTPCTGTTKAHLLMLRGSQDIPFCVSQN